MSGVYNKKNKTIGDTTRPEALSRRLPLRRLCEDLAELCQGQQLDNDISRGTGLLVASFRLCCKDP